MKQQRDALLKEKETAEKIAARAFAQSYLADLVPSVFTRLSQNGFFYDPVERGTCVCVCMFAIRTCNELLDFVCLQKSSLSSCLG